MAFTIGIASDYLNLFQRIRRYVTGAMGVENEITNPANIGDGYIKGLMAGSVPVVESWTLTCSTGGGVGVGVFSVVGSISGAQAVATVGADWTSPLLDFRILEGATPYSVGDEFTFDIVANDIPSVQQWEELKYVAGVPNAGAEDNNGMNYVAGPGATEANELYLKGPGLAGVDEIFVNMSTYYSESSDYYNLNMYGATGFETLDALHYQPGESPGTCMCAWQFQIPYWIVADGRRMIINFKVSTNYMSGYFGWILPYATPTEYPYPLYIAGTYVDNGAIRWSSESHNHRSFFDPYAGYLYTIQGTWLTIQNKYSSSGNEASPSTSNVWPYGGNLVSNIRQSPGDVYPMLPMVIHSDQSGGNVLGELAGCFWCPGFANASENTIVVSGLDYVVIQDVYRTSSLDYFALKLE